MTLKMNEFGRTLGLRLIGKEICRRIAPVISRKEKIVLDFEDVDMITDSCADEIFTTLIHQYGFETFKTFTSFSNYNKQIENMILNKIHYAIVTLK